MLNLSLSILSSIIFPLANHLSGRSGDLLNNSLKRLWVSTNNLINLLSVLEDEERWHGADADLLGNIWDVVDVDLDEVGRWVLLGEPEGVILVYG